MANNEHQLILERGVEKWNEWRDKNPRIIPDLSGIKLWRAELSRANFSGADLSGADLKWSNLYRSNFTGACLSGTDLQGTNLHKAVFNGASLQRTTLSYATLTEASLKGASLSDCRVHGIAVWDTDTDQSTQRNLIITRPEEPAIYVDDIEVAQFIHMLINHSKLRKVINSVTQKGVLVLGRFGGGGVEILQSIASNLRKNEYLPIIFDFERPHDRDYTETVKTLVGLSRFVIVDLSGPSVPQELYATVPCFAIPFVPIIERGRRPHSMFVDFLKYDWVLKPVVEFASREHLMEILPSRIIDPAEVKLKQRQQLLDQLFS